MRKITLVRNQDWSERFLTEQTLLAKTLLELDPIIHHVGSTAIKNIVAKPIIDMILIVEDVTDLDNFDTAFINLGYEPMGEFGIEGRRFFKKGGDNRTHHIHAFSSGNAHIRRHLIFRDYLNAIPDKAAEYEQLKLQLVEKFSTDTQKYTEGKNSLVAQLDAEANAWAAQSNQAK